MSTFDPDSVHSPSRDSMREKVASEEGSSGSVHLGEGQISG